MVWARGLARSSEHLLVVLLKCFQRLGYFPKLGDVPEMIVAHVRSSLDRSPTGIRLWMRAGPTAYPVDVLGTLPAVPATARERVVRRIEIDWARVLLSCLVALVPLGPLGNVAVALLTSVVEQLWAASGGGPLAPRPAEPCRPSSVVAACPVNPCQ